MQIIKLYFVAKKETDKYITFSVYAIEQDSLVAVTDICFPNDKLIPFQRIKREDYLRKTWLEEAVSNFWWHTTQTPPDEKGFTGWYSKDLRIIAQWLD